MLIQAGFDIAFQCPARTPMLLHLNVHPSREPDLHSPDVITSDPPLPMRAYLDHFGNRVTRVVVPPGLVTFSNRFVIQDSGEPDETPPDTDLTSIDDLPDDVLLYLVSSRYCDNDKLADFAWSTFGAISGGYKRVKAICDFVHSKIRFSYPDARPTRWISAAGSRSIWMDDGTRWTRVTTIRASGALSWDAAVTRRTSRSRRPLASPISCALT
jgi:transglutaminase-like putative cysteine protease